jgi:hypothetical protein
MHFNTFFRAFLLSLCTLLLTSTGFAQESVYDHTEAFDPGFLSSSVSPYRTASGAPAANYWQNRADYDINVTLDTTQHRLSGVVTIHYTNNSPNDLEYVWIQLDQNAFKPDSRASQTAMPGSTNGYELGEITLLQEGQSVTPRTLVSDTRLKVWLPEPLQGGGDAIDITIPYAFDIHSKSTGRMGWGRYQDGSIYELAQWFPRMCVYDDIHGWDTLPYLGMGEFYLDYGTIDYRVTAPSSFVVAGSGSLVNESKVLSTKLKQRLDQARESDKPVSIVSFEELPALQQQTGKKIWHFQMENTRDVAFAAGDALAWDACRTTIEGQDDVLAMSLYPKEAVGEDGYQRSAEMVQQAVKYFAEKFYPYPWSTAINVSGPVGGMEYPGIAFCYPQARGKALWSVLSHEVGHFWYPMIVGSNERRHAFMDEGFNTFIDIYAQEWYHDGEFAPKRDGEYAPDGGNPADEILDDLLDPAAEPIITYADVLSFKMRHPILYYKPALGLVILREYILGPKRFDDAFKTYTRRWAFKHPTPEDFFATMNDATGEELNYFWKGWFYNEWLVDQAISAVSYRNDDPTQGAVITLKNLQKLPLPVKLKIVEHNGHTETVKLPVEVWQRSDTWPYSYPSSGPIDSVIVDPDHQLPDIDRDNNTWISHAEN